MDTVKSWYDTLLLSARAIDTWTPQFKVSFQRPLIPNIIFGMDANLDNDDNINEWEAI